MAESTAMIGTATTMIMGMNGMAIITGASSGPKT
jgi:hypothetical protein